MARRFLQFVNSRTGDRAEAPGKVEITGKSEREIERLIDPDLWDFVWRDALGKPPSITITGYKGS